jgi:hypothetical protein
LFPFLGKFGRFGDSPHPIACKKYDLSWKREKIELLKKEGLKRRKLPEKTTKTEESTVPL